MADVDPSRLVATVIEHQHCSQCGGELGTHEFEGRERDYCPDCDRIFTRKPIPAVHVIVHDGEEVLVLDEDIPQAEGILTLPGGHVEYDEHPTESAVRGLEEESGLAADPDDLDYLTTLHVEFPGKAFYFLTYTLDRADASGELVPEMDGSEAAFRPLDEIRAAAEDDRIRENNVERIEQALDAS